jgi:hypothetical protein
MLKRIGKRVSAILRETGFRGLLRQLRSAITWRFREQWNLKTGVVQVVDADLALPVEVIPTKVPMEVRLFEKSDLPNIRENIFPHLTGSLQSDRRIFESIERGTDRGEQMLVAVLGGRIVHYMMWIRASKYAGLKLGPDEVFYVAAFTHPDARGLGLVQHTTTLSMRMFQEWGLRRAVATIHRDNPGMWKATGHAGFGPVGRPRARLQPLEAKVG